MDQLRASIREFLGLGVPAAERQLLVHEEVREVGYTRKAVSYSSGGERVQAFLFEPLGERRGGAVVALHQHNSQWRFGKSEIAGLVGDPHQAFGPALARAGCACWRPMRGVSIRGSNRWRCQRRPSWPRHRTRSAAARSPSGLSTLTWPRIGSRAVKLLMRELLLDIDAALQVLRDVTGALELGLVGHSYGGNLALFAAALNEGVAFAVSSGAVC
ncbi:MAG: hypothetical protein QM756_19005 [Polyangiaceae bacterium]